MPALGVFLYLICTALAYFGHDPISSLILKGLYSLRSPYRFSRKQANPKTSSTSIRFNDLAYFYCPPFLRKQLLRDLLPLPHHILKLSIWAVS